MIHDMNTDKYFLVSDSYEHIKFEFLAIDLHVLGTTSFIDNIKHGL